MVTRASIAETVAAGTDKSSATTEFGATGLRQYSGYVREEWLRDLIGRKGMMKLREMRDNDPIINAVLFAIEMLLRGVSFHVDPDDEANTEDVKAADFIQSCFGDMEHSWSDFIADALSFLQFGFGVYEIVYKYRRGPEEDDPAFKSQYTDGLLGWRKFAGRAQETMLHWVFNASGDAVAMIQLLPTGGPLLNVPLSKCLHFRTTPYKANPEGRPLIRSMYNYYFLKRNVQQIEAIGVSRDLAGLLTVYVPAGWTKDDAAPQDKLAMANVRAMVNEVAQNEQSGLVLPSIYDANNNKLLDVTLLATGGRRQFATTEIIGRYDQGMAATALADFITLGTGTSTNQGTGSQSINKTDLFSSAVVQILDIIAAQFERKGCPDLLRLNAMRGKVKVTHGDISRTDLAEVGQYITAIASAGLLVPDATLEAHLREEGGLPPADDPEQAQMVLPLGEDGDGTGKPGDAALSPASGNPRLARQQPKPPVPVIAPGGPGGAKKPTKPVGKRTL